MSLREKTLAGCTLCMVFVYLAASSISGFCGVAQADTSVQITRWQPENTRVFLVSLTRFKGGAAAPWGEKDRLDGDFVNLLKSRGVPESKIVFLADEQAGTENVKREFDSFLGRSAKGELLIFYFSSHGHYDPKTGSFAYIAYDGALPFEWAFDAIERSFKGSHALMFADCCYSGGIVEMAQKRRTAIAYACLSSTYSHNVGFSGWRFFDCIMRGFGGSGVVDLNGNGRIELDELVRFTEKHMAFVAEGRPMFTTTNGFNPKLVLADSNRAKKAPQIGQYVEAQYKGEWQKAEITDLKPGYVKVHHTGKGSTYNDWVSMNQIRPFKFQHFEKGSRVEAKGASSGKWFPASVLDSWESLHFCRFDGYSPAYDEWVGPSRIRNPAVASNLSGKWAGQWQNSLNEKGDDSFILEEDADGNLSGTWSGNVKVEGKRTGLNTAKLSGQKENHIYNITVTAQQEAISLQYVGRPLNGAGSYEGKSTLNRTK